MNRPTPTQILVLGLGIGLPPWTLSLLSDFSSGGSFGFFAANATLALAIAYYAGSDSRPMSDLMQLSLAFLGLLFVFAFLYSLLLLSRPIFGIIILFTLGPLFGVYYSFRRTTEPSSDEDGEDSQ